jgi:predicted 2-oxoglutarate/Fe(II)-dependent dioxygenase YbiX
MFAPEFFGSLGIFFERDFLDADCCAQLLKEVESAPADKGQILHGEAEPVVIETARQVLCARVTDTTTDLVKSRLLEMRPRLEAYFGAKLTDFVSPNFLIYRPGAFYVPHADKGPASSAPVARRQVSVVIFLNGASTEPRTNHFGGGALTFYGLLDGPQWRECGFPLAAEPGLLVAFRSDTVHEVQPVVHGTRCSVVSWFLGTT